MKNNYSGDWYMKQQSMDENTLNDFYRFVISKCRTQKHLFYFFSSHELSRLSRSHSTKTLLRIARGNSCYNYELHISWMAICKHFLEMRRNSCRTCNDKYRKRGHQLKIHHSVYSEDERLEPLETFTILCDACHSDGIHMLNSEEGFRKMGRL